MITVTKPSKTPISQAESIHQLCSPQETGRLRAVTDERALSEDADRRLTCDLIFAKMTVDCLASYRPQRIPTVEQMQQKATNEGAPTDVAQELARRQWYVTASAQMDRNYVACRTVITALCTYLRIPAEFRATEHTQNVSTLTVFLKEWYGISNITECIDHDLGHKLAKQATNSADVIAHESAPVRESAKHIDIKPSKMMQEPIFGKARYGSSWYDKQER